ncbi:MAG: hypothetical protein V1688_01095 [bacterium]
MNDVFCKKCGSPAQVNSEDDGWYRCSNPLCENYRRPTFRVIDYFTLKVDKH